LIMVSPAAKKTIPKASRKTVDSAASRQLIPSDFDATVAFDWGRRW
jgi:hypothetical protein